ncbi:MAG TPA: heme-dependent oxidative N-demethylase subunit alpha family protein [Burkholderiaceae bacterium]|nr:heme-dependent oxidative N-demethylase subunit alpha family protein [Burkholderiaceae bacterium]
MPFDFAAVSAPFRMQPGLRRLAPGAAPLTASGAGDRALAEKLEVLRDRPDDALVAVDGFDAVPALRALMHQALHDVPDAFRWDGADAFDARRLGWSVHGCEVRGNGPREIGTVLHALPPAQRLTGLLCLALAEDFAVIDGTTARIPWLAVCLPSRWAPAEKVGRHFAEVHAPVADNALLLAAGDGLARLVTGTDRWERFVWTISNDARLAQHPQHTPPTGWPAHASAAELAAHAHFRTEHQTFIPMPALGQAVFTIRVESRPLADAIDSSERARQVHDALASMSPAVLEYRGLTDARDRVLAWLAARAAARP